MITQRRVFRSKVGQSAGVVEKMREFQKIFDRHGGPKCRIYTDRYGGNTDTVIWEFDVESLSKLEEQSLARAESPEYRREYEAWYEGLRPLIEGAAVEILNRVE